ncbi:hypothetical protein Anas_04572 [Armadillidium nasatum]|uniref:Uncharacterized protein n=1 Tax=Armadillidium nasatum TaxID=96803 RepID=A0A5N5TI11_9CRUS|nr:hypothetical protein Anas_04572 [Armadillidium nasatum]
MDTRKLFSDMMEALSPFKEEIVHEMNEEALLKMKIFKDALSEWLTKKLQETEDDVFNLADSSKRKLRDVITSTMIWIEKQKTNVNEVVGKTHLIYESKLFDESGK